MINKKADSSVCEYEHIHPPLPDSISPEPPEGFHSSLAHRVTLSTENERKDNLCPSWSLSRRGFWGTIAGLVGWFFALRPYSSSGEDGLPRNIPEAISTWIGTVLEYKASCHLLEDFASGQLWIQGVESTNQYLVVMETRLHGIAGVISQQRMDLMASLVQWSGANRKFLPLWHADQVSRHGSWKRKVLVFQNGAKSYTEWRLSPENKTSRVLPSGGRGLQDPLCAFLNWRVGTYGPLGPGQKLVIDDLARKEPLRVTLEVLPEAEAVKKRPPGKEDWIFYVQAHVDREVAESIQGSLEGWLDRHWTPVFARSTHVRVIGEVWARLAGRWKLPQPVRPVAPAPPLQTQKWAIF